MVRAIRHLANGKLQLGPMQTRNQPLRLDPTHERMQRLHKCVKHNERLEERQSHGDFGSRHNTGRNVNITT